MTATLATAVSTSRRVLKSGTSLILVTVVTISVVRIVSTILLTRLLEPADFGVAGIMAMLVMMLKSITDFGFGLYIVQHPQGADPRLLDALWTARLLRSVALTFGMALLASPIATALGKPELAAAVAVTALHFVLDGLSSLAPVTAVRDQRLLRLNALDVVTTILQVALGVALATLLKSYWAIVLSGLVSTALRSVLTYTMFDGARRRLHFDWAQVQSLLKFGRLIVGGELIQMLVWQVDKAVLSRLMPLSAFGLYNLSANLAAAPTPFTSTYPHQILLPAYAKVHREEPARLAQFYYDKRMAVSMLYMTGMGAFIGFAPATVDILYDDRYADAATYLRLLALAPLLSFGNYAAREVLIVTGRVRAYFYANLIRLGWLAIGGTAGFLVCGSMGLVAAVGTVEFAVMLYSWWELNRATLLRPSRELLLLLMAGAGATIGLAAAELWSSAFA